MSGAVEGNEVRKILAQFDAPAFVRRARSVEVADELLHAALTARRQLWLTMPQTRLAQLHSLLGGDLARLRDLPATAAHASALCALYDQWQPRLRSRTRAVSSLAEAVPAVQKVAESFGNFNRRWQPFVEQFDVSEVNRIRAGYNEYYVLEKECSTGSAALARRGFTPLEPVTPAVIFGWYPLLPEWERGLRR